jgi:hypothetical protein
MEVVSLERPQEISLCDTRLQHVTMNRDMSERASARRPDNATIQHSNNTSMFSDFKMSRPRTSMELKHSPFSRAIHKRQVRVHGHATLAFVLV